MTRQHHCVHRQFTRVSVPRLKTSEDSSATHYVLTTTNDYFFACTLKRCWVRVTVRLIIGLVGNVFNVNPAALLKFKLGTFTASRGRRGASWKWVLFRYLFFFTAPLCHVKQYKTPTHLYWGFKFVRWLGLFVLCTWIVMGFSCRKQERYNWARVIVIYYY